MVVSKLFRCASSKGKLKLNWLTVCCRWDYSVSPARPPHYSLYTLLSLGDTFIALYVILGSAV